MSSCARFAITILVTLLGASPAAARSAGPPDARTGAPGEGTCNDVFCHSDFPLNSGAVTLELIDADGAPLLEYAPGSILEIGLRLSSTEAGRRRWGFEARALDASGGQAGEFAVGAQVGVQVTPPGAGTYVKHTLNGLGDLQTAGQEWRFVWETPPPGDGPVVVHACGNAANRSFTPAGDYIECVAFELAELDPTADSDGDGVVDAEDNCIVFENPGQDDANGDGLGDACDLDWGDVAPVGAPDGLLNVSDVIRVLRLAVDLEEPEDLETFRRANVGPADLSGGEPQTARPTNEEPRVLDVADVILVLRASVDLIVFAEPR